MRQTIICGVEDVPTDQVAILKWPEGTGWEAGWSYNVAGCEWQLQLDQSNVRIEIYMIKVSVDVNSLDLDNLEKLINGKNN